MLTTDDCPSDGSEEQKELQGLDYRWIVGFINYLATTTRPDLAFAVHCLSRFVQNPGHVHYLAAKHVLRYLRGTSDLALVYRHDRAGILLTGYTDSDFAGDRDSRRSTSGYCFFTQRESAAIRWCSRRQSIVAMSTAEAEVNAATAAA